jgi:hypothetical protein
VSAARAFGSGAGTRQANSAARMQDGHHLRLGSGDSAPFVLAGGPPRLVEAEHAPGAHRLFSSVIDEADAGGLRRLRGTRSDLRGTAQERAVWSGWVGGCPLPGHFLAVSPALTFLRAWRASRPSLTRMPRPQRSQVE